MVGGGRALFAAPARRPRAHASQPCLVSRRLRSRSPWERALPVKKKPSQLLCWKSRPNSKPMSSGYIRGLPRGRLETGGAGPGPRIPGSGGARGQSPDQDPPPGQSARPDPSEERPPPRGGERATATCPACRTSAGTRSSSAPTRTWRREPPGRPPAPRTAPAPGA